MSEATDPAGTAHQYGDGQRRLHHPALLERFRRDGAAALAAPGVRRDLRYGDHPRCRFDLFPAPDAGADAPLLLFLHAGYWQGRAKEEFAFLGPALAARGWRAALANYPLCPETSLDGIVAAIRPLPAAVLAAAGGAPGGLVLAGHSAGAHLAVELATGPGAPAVSAVLAVSGVFDLRPLLGTPINRALGLDHDAAARRSLPHRVPAGMPPAAMLVGGAETPAFVAQNAAMAAAWRAAGNPAHRATVPGEDHFSVLDALADGRGPAGAALRWLRAAATGR